MLTKEDLGRLLEYTVWANHRVMRVAATLAPDDFKRDLGSSHGGIRGTLTHMMGAEWIWLERFKGVSPTRGLDESEFADIVALRDRWTLIEQHRADWFRSLREPEVAGPVAFRTLAGAAFEAPLWELLQHVANHASYHRGQVVALLRQLGARTVSTDMLFWDRENKQGGAASRPPDPPRAPGK
jgi:uncharacterized damage-inducible protein DinB